MEADIIAVSDNYEVHPGAAGGWTVVSLTTGEALANFSTSNAAVRDAERREEERSESRL